MFALRAEGLPMKHLNGMFASILALLLMIGVSRVEAQVVSVDTILVTIVGDVPEDGVTIDSFLVSREWRLNDTIPLVASWLDSESDPVPGVVFTWGTDRPDLLTVFQDAGGAWFAMPIGKGAVHLYVRAEASDVMHVGFLNPDRTINWAGGEVGIGRTARFCAYLVTARNALVAESPGPPTCPMAFLPQPSTLDRVFANTTRSISWNQLWRIGTSLRRVKGQD